MDYVSCLPSEILEKIVVLALGAVEQPVESAEYVAENIALVNRSWNTALNTVGWEALLFRHLGVRLHCEPDDAMWLLRVLRSPECRVSWMTITQARSTFRISSKDLKDHGGLVPVERLDGRKTALYAPSQLVAAAIAKHCGIPAFRAHMMKCEVSATLSRGVEMLGAPRCVPDVSYRSHCGPSTLTTPSCLASVAPLIGRPFRLQMRKDAARAAARVREDARMREVEEALAGFSPEVRILVDTRPYIANKSGTLQGLRDEASRREKRLRRAHEIARLVGLDLQEYNMCEEGIHEFVAGWIGEIRLACIFRRELEVRSLPVRKAERCRRYVLKGGDFAAVAEDDLSTEEFLSI
jgi:hypothetical protein